MSAAHTCHDPAEAGPDSNTRAGGHPQATASTPLGSGVLINLTGDTEHDAAEITETVGTAYAAIIGARLLADRTKPLVLTRGTTAAASDLEAQLGSRGIAREFARRLLAALEGGAVR